MGMIENEDRLQLRIKAKDFIIGAGSAITTSQITTALETNTHTAINILTEFQENGFLRTQILAPETNNPVTLWYATPQLSRVTEERLREIIRIEKPKARKENE